MSKYTTEVRFICEQEAGLDESEGFASVDDVIASSWNKIFTTKCEFFDEAYRGVLCRKILKHYYLREIGAETVGVWKLWVNTKLEEIMSYYNQLYESAKIEFNPMHDTNLTRTHNRTENEKSEGERNGKTNSDSNRNENLKELYSDTPQGSITNLENETYLTNATINVNNISNKDNSTSEENTTSDINTTEDYIENVTGKQGTESFSSLLTKFRDTFLNIDLMVIDEFSDLFMGLW
jgi:hypothetical protein